MHTSAYVKRVWQLYVLLGFYKYLDMWLYVHLKRYKCVIINVWRGKIVI